MIYPKIPLAQTVIELFKIKGIKHIVISPGSRNAPLTIGFTNNPYFTCYSIVDERCAAFFALGIAQQLKVPTAVVCTSGSALVNYYPAVTEAYYSDIPLVVVSADRPKHLIGIGDGQTINQKNIFENHILYSVNLKLDVKDENNIPENEELPMLKNLEDKLERFLGLQKDIQTHNEEEINEALNFALLKKGPVHINIPFDEPLYETVEKLRVTPKSIKPALKPKVIEDYVLNECLQDWNSTSKKMILVGANYPNEIDKKWLKELADDDSVVVFTETTSNLYHESFFPSIDQIVEPLTEEEKKALQPEILLTFGGLIVSKKIKTLLRKFQPKYHWHVDEKSANDTFFCLSNHIDVTPNQFFSVFLPKITHYVKSNYNAHWTDVKNNRLKKHNEYLKTIPFTDLKVFDILFKNIPSDHILQIANSSAIRYAQLFDINKNNTVFCNRGTSGIDGSTSTAIGCAVVNDKPTTLITGDLSFLYDSNGLWNNYIPKNFRIIVINNQGGGIFRILPGHKNSDNFETFFETTHNLNARHLCRMYGFAYKSVSKEKPLEYYLKEFFVEDGRPKLLEIFTPKNINDEVLLQYFEYLK
ncbi:2-succinyl-5-enolpyruvyl-6-hydroxy-3-cyclohexene-1-carboxylate synthase [Mariniflexile rhizosphaerae]|uniref:2-succinyl-5-enolpyruvyl-6-hydroxy-3- cyclohexene-1-carboxylate synthase n=1 Tax=unclassified Mariniflexile TaxID=2643887 RepID=UPI000CCA28A2|nr:2-succinyl-5-enolpyruvyl-6-hydroxy-3-cyclohexene-1-carboxylate synthase [Mariniflexile sp. TRM1-10]AXP82693.1 2-succinyl-5-enolpyruvyl-6-hydroxy-3-cyclohexene-1-carboxylate synthase [Mariniflexile sp. TRM1-10]PLB18903.1 MAG: 2-succinyl-5-enolpyruvyl-6-hydroxy-3-cyclohexene-1- carboxylate synthase [Flavobacteriaceae bacterium FS1-H7996/R]